MYENCESFKFDHVIDFRDFMDWIPDSFIFYTWRTRLMLFGHLVSVARLFAQFHAGTRKSPGDFMLPLLAQPIKFVLVYFTGQLSTA